MIMLNAILTSLGMGISNRLNWSHMHNFSRILQSTKHLLQNYLVCSVAMQIKIFKQYIG